MIISFSVKNFRSIKDRQTLSFEASKSKDLEEYYVCKVGRYRLLKLAMLYGANASGKTNVLKALDFLFYLVRSTVFNKEAEIAYDTFRFDSACMEENTQMDIEFIYETTKYSYSVEFNHTCIVSEKLCEFDPRKSVVFERTTDTTKQLPKIKFGPKVKVNQLEKDNLTTNTLWNTTVLSGFNRISANIPQLRNVLNWFGSYMLPISPRVDLDSFVLNQMAQGNIDKMDIINLLNKADLGISDISLQHRELDLSNPNAKELFIQNVFLTQRERTQIQTTSKMDVFDLRLTHTIDGKSFSLSMRDESMGTQRYYGLSGILLLLIKRNTIMMIDELETSLHPDLYRHFIISYLKHSHRSQLIVTTHNREILGDRDLFRNDAIWFTDRGNSEQKTELYRLDYFDSSVVTDKTNILNLYRIGKLGGVPNLDNIN